MPVDDTPDDLPCAWAPAKDAFYRAYHDEEWGVPEYDSRSLWEKLQLDGMQAGLSWITILRKRASMREEFDGFEPERIARWDQKRIDKALQNPGIIRSPKKIEACIGNARAYLAAMEKGEDFSQWLWSYVDNKPIVGEWQTIKTARQSPIFPNNSPKTSKSAGTNFVAPSSSTLLCRPSG